MSTKFFFPVLLQTLALTFLLVSSTFASPAINMGVPNGSASAAEYVPAEEAIEYVQVDIGGHRQLQGYQTCKDCKCCSANDPSNCMDMQCCYAFTCKPDGTCSFAPRSCDCNSCA